MKAPFPTLDAHIRTLRSWLATLNPCGGMSTDPETGTVTAFVRVTPELAKQLLDYEYAGQRSVSRSQVRKLKIARKSNSWLNHNPVILSVHMTPEGEIISIHIINGQHTLLMVVDTEPAYVKIELRVSSGRSYTSDMFNRIDVGKSRTQRDANLSADIYNRLGFNEKTKKEKTFCDRSTAASVYLLGGLSQSRGDSQEDKDKKITVAVRFADEIRTMWNTVQTILDQSYMRPGKEDLIGIDTKIRYTKLYNSLTHAPIFAYLLLSLRYHQSGIEGFIRDIIGHHESQITAKAARNAGPRSVMAQRTLTYLLDKKRGELPETERACHAAVFHQLFTAYLNGEERTIDEAKASSNRHTVWADVTGSAFATDVLGID